MAERTGENLYVELVYDAGGTTQLTQVRSVRFSNEGGGVPRIDVTHAGDSVTQYKDAIPDTPKEVATIMALDEDGTSGIYIDLANADGKTDGTLRVYPDGKEADKIVEYATGYMLKPVFSRGYAEVQTAEVAFHTDESSSYKFTREVYAG